MYIEKIRKSKIDEFIPKHRIQNKKLEKTFLNCS